MDARIKKLIRDYNYLTETLEDVKEISAMAEPTLGAKRPANYRLFGGSRKPLATRDRLLVIAVTEKVF